MTNENLDIDKGKPKSKRNLWGIFAFFVSVIPFSFFALLGNSNSNYQVTRYILVISGFAGLVCSVKAFIGETRGTLLSRFGVLFAIMGALLGTSIGILALLPILMKLE